MHLQLASLALLLPSTLGIHVKYFYIADANGGNGNTANWYVEVDGQKVLSQNSEDYSQCTVLYEGHCDESSSMSCRDNRGTEWYYTHINSCSADGNGSYSFRRGDGACVCEAPMTTGYSGWTTWKVAACEVDC